MTDFALLLTGKKGGTDENDYTIAWIALAFIIAAIVIFFISSISYDIYCRYQLMKNDRKFKTSLDRVSDVMGQDQRNI